MNARFTPFISLLIFTLFICHNVTGQETLSDFGKNRIQYKDFNWRFYSTENFDIYFYRGGEDNAKLAAEFLEEDYLRMTDILGYAPYSKTKIFLYNSVADLQQSNVGVNENNYTVGGQTNFVKSQVELAYPGTHEDFKNELQLKIAEMLLNDMMFGGSLSDMFQSTYLLNLPRWFLDGAALYMARGWSVEMDDHMRDLFEEDDKQIRKLARLDHETARIAGQSVWNFIAERYGSSNISNILNLTRIIRNEESSIANTLGIPFKNFMAEWQSYYSSMAARVRENYVAPSDGSLIQGNSKKNYIYNKVKISPDGNYLAYSKNYNGKFWVMLRDLNTGKEKKLFKGGNKALGQESDENIPLIAWQDNSTLGVVGVKKGNTVLWLYDLGSDSKLLKDLNRFNQVNDFSFSESGGVAVFSADMNGQSDIFLYGVRRNRIKRITNDLYDDINPKFVPGTKAIIFASNRDTDSLRSSSADQTLDQITENYNLFFYDIDTTKAALVRVTNTISKDVNPLPLDKNSIYYLSDQKGIYNLFKYSISDSLYTQVTNFQTSIEDYDIHPENNKLAFIMMDEGVQNIYYVPDAELNESNFTVQTPRKQVLQAKYIAAKFRERDKDKIENQEEGADPEEISMAEDTIPANESVVDDTLTGETPTGIINTDDYVFGDDSDVEETPTGVIDTDNYVFDKEVVQQEQQNDASFLARFRKLGATPSEVYGPFDYEPRFSADNIVVSWVIDPLMGFGIQAELEMNDMLEDHKVYGGILATTNLKSGKIYGEYHYLKHFIDFRARFERKNIFYEEVDTRQRYTLNKFEIGGAYPVSNTSRLSFNPFFATTRYVDLNETLLTPGRNNENTNILLNYLGGRAEFVYDNTLVKGLNLFEGTKGKLTYEFYQNMEDAVNNFSKLELELRHYQKISREITLAGRLFYGRFMGNAAKSYLLGGMDNAILNRSTDISGTNDPLYTKTELNNSDLLFNQYVTNLRGFDYNKFNGTNAVLLNVELRLPIIRYFVQGPIASNFFRNLQFIGFYDIGSAWTGATPFAEENSANTEVIKSEGGPFVATLRNFKNPWLQSYGTGVRTVLLGYYLKFDVAWPVEDYHVKSPEFYLSLGFDF